VVVVLLVAFVLYRAFSGKIHLLKFEGRFPAPGTVIGKVTGLYIYPVKSGQAVSLSRCDLDGCGMAGDRRLMLISKKGTKVTQLICPKLATLQATFPPQSNMVLLRGPPPENAELVVSLTPSDTAPKRDVMVIVTSCQCVDLGDEAAAFCDRISGRSGDRLVMQVQGSYRYIKDYPLWFGQSPSSKDRTSLQDFGPLLLTNERSLASLNLKIPAEQRSGMDRFRANVVITTDPQYAWIEDHFKTVTVGKAVFRWMAPCIRCLQPCIDQTTGQADYITKGMRHAQPTRALREFHPGSLKRSILGFQTIHQGGAGGFAPAFGVLLTHSVHTDAQVRDQDTYGQLAVGDDVTVLEYLRPTFMQRLFGV